MMFCAVFYFMISSGEPVPRLTSQPMSCEAARTLVEETNYPTERPGKDPTPEYSAVYRRVPDNFDVAASRRESNNRIGEAK
jgi:hypothetical protein